MKSLLHIFLTSIVALSCACCHFNSRVDGVLSEAEMLMAEHPDSSLALLEAVNPSELRSESSRALYGLLLTQAQFKNYIDVDNDSLIAPSVNYYESSGNDHYKMLSQYYLGEVYHKAKDYSKALPILIQSYALADDLQDHFWMGMIAWSISDIYNSSYCKAEEIEFAEKAMVNFRHANIQPYMDYALLQLSQAYVNGQEFDKSLPIARSVKDSANVRKNGNLRIEADRLIGISLVGLKNYNEALQPFNEVCSSGHATKSDSLYLGLVLLRIGNIEKAKSVIMNDYKSSNGLENWVNYEFAMAIDEEKNAIRYLQNMESETDSILRSLLNRNIAGAITNYYEFEKKLKDAELKNSHIIIWCGGILCSFILGGLTFLLIRYRKKQKIAIEKNIVIAEVLRTTMAKNTQWQSSVKTLLSDRFEILDRLCRILYENSDSSVAKKRISEEVALMKMQFTEDRNMLNEMSCYVDKHYDKIITKLRFDFPELKEIDYRLIIYIILGFSTPVIAMFLTDNKVTLIYARKKRLKNKIIGSDSKYKELYLQAIFQGAEN